MIDVRLIVQIIAVAAPCLALSAVWRRRVVAEKRREAEWHTQMIAKWGDNSRAIWICGTPFPPIDWSDRL